MGSVRNPPFRRYTHQGGEHEDIRTIHQCMECRWNAHVRTVLDRTAGRRVAWVARAGCDLGGIRSSVDEIPEGAGRGPVAGAAGAHGGGVMGRPGTLCHDATRGGREGAKNRPSRRACLAGHPAFPAVVSRVTIGRKNTRGCVTHPRVCRVPAGAYVEAGRCDSRKLRTWRTATGILSGVSFHGYMLNWPFGASIALSTATAYECPAVSSGSTSTGV